MTTATKTARKNRTKVPASRDAGGVSAFAVQASTGRGVLLLSDPSLKPDIAKVKEKLRERLLQRKRWIRQAQRWRTGCEGRISLLKRPHGLNRCRYEGEDGMRRWVGLGVIADKLINIGLALNAATAQRPRQTEWRTRGNARDATGC